MVIVRITNRTPLPHGPGLCVHQTSDGWAGYPLIMLAFCRDSCYVDNTITWRGACHVVDIINFVAIVRVYVHYMKCCSA